jgi:hypothetical protein
MFWLKHPTDIFDNPTVVPNRHMTDDEILNAVSRLIIVVGIFLCLFSLLLGLSVIIIGLILIVIFWYCQNTSTNNVRAVGHYTCDKRRRRDRKRVCEECSKNKHVPKPTKKITILPRY